MGHKDYMRTALKYLDPMLETGPTIFATSITFSWLMAILSKQQVLRLIQYNRFKKYLISKYGMGTHYIYYTNNKVNCIMCFTFEYCDEKLIVQILRDLWVLNHDLKKLNSIFIQILSSRH